jgi:hypothetical protein
LCVLAASATLALPFAGISTILGTTAASAQSSEGVSLSSVAINGVEGTPFNGVVATVNEPEPHDITLNPISIDWGDGSLPSSGTLGASLISGTHTYLEAGSYTVTMTATPAPADLIAVKAASTLSTTSTAVITEATTTLDGVGGVLADQGAFDGNVASGTDAYPGGAKLADFSAVIDWGDGSPTTSCTSCISGPGGSSPNFDVSGTHQYTHAGFYVIKTVVTDGSTATTPAYTYVVVPLVANAITTAGEGQEYKGVVGSVLTFPIFQAEIARTAKVAAISFPRITFPTPQVTINWGDDTASVLGTVNPLTGDVSGTHTYTEEGTYTITLTVNSFVLQSSLAALKVASHTATPLATAINTVTVPDAPITTSITTSSYSITTGQSVSGTLAHVFDADINSALSDFSAVIDWGDGNTSAGNVLVDPAGGYNVTGSHLYTSTGTKSAKVKVLDLGGSTSTAPFTVVVTAPANNPTSTPTPNPNSGVQGIISVPNTGGGELPVAPALLLVAAGGALFVAGRRRMR